MYVEQEQSLRKGHDLPEAILQNVISIYEELESLEKIDRYKHQSKVQMEFEKVLSSIQFRIAGKLWWDSDCTQQVTGRLENEKSVAKLRVIEEARFQMKKLEEEKQAAIRHLKVIDAFSQVL
jgi:hypothetical protein